MKTAWGHLQIQAEFSKAGDDISASASQAETGDQHADSLVRRHRICWLSATGRGAASWLQGDSDCAPSGKELEKRDGLTATAGDVYDTDSLALLIAGHDALISAFNPGWTPGTVKPEMYDEQVRGTSSIIAAARKAGIKRVLWVGGAGGLEVAPGVQSIDAPGFPEWIKPGSRATSDALEQLQKLPELDWSFLAPSAKLEPGQRTGKFRLGGDQLLVDANGESRISVQDYAVAMIDELERPAHIRQRFTVGY